MQALKIMSGACVALCIFLASATADDAQQEKPPAPQVRKIYDVSDLALSSAVDASTTAVVPPTDLSTGRDARSGTRGGGGGGGGLMGNVPKTTTLAERTEDIGKLIQETIEPNTWRDGGTGEGWIRSLGPRLIVQNTAAIHAQTAEFLADLRKNQNRSIQIRATWVALSDDELRSVARPSTAAAKGSLSRVDLTAIDQIKGAVMDRTEINTLTGIAVNVTAGRARTVLSSLDAVIGNGVAALQPNIDLLLSGTALQLTPVLSPDGASVRIDLRAVESSWEPADSPPIKIPGPVAATQPTVPPNSSAVSASTPPAEIERLNLPVHYITTSVRIPTQEATLIGGFANNAKDLDARHWYLIIEASTSQNEKGN